MGLDGIENQSQKSTRVDLGKPDDLNQSHKFNKSTWSCVRCFSCEMFSTLRLRGFRWPFIVDLPGLLIENSDFP